MIGMLGMLGMLGRRRGVRATKVVAHCQLRWVDQRPPQSLRQLRLAQMIVERRALRFGRSLELVVLPPCVVLVSLRQLPL